MYYLVYYNTIIYCNTICRLYNFIFCSNIMLLYEGILTDPVDAVVHIT